MASRRMGRTTCTGLIALLWLLSIAAWVELSATPADAAAVGCRTVRLKEHIPTYGWQHFRTRFCYNQHKQRVAYAGINITEVEPNLIGKAFEFKISNERKDHASIMNGRGLVIYNISTVEACTPAACAHRETLFKVRAYWDGGYQWRINKTTGQVSGPP